MFDALVNWFSSDPRSISARRIRALFVRDRGIVVDEPSVVAVETVKGGRQQVLPLAVMRKICWDGRPMVSKQ